MSVLSEQVKAEVAAYDAREKLRAMEAQQEPGKPLNPIAAFKAAVEKKQKNGLSLREATKAVCLEDPDLHYAYASAVNENDRKRRFG